MTFGLGLGRLGRLGSVGGQQQRRQILTFNGTNSYGEIVEPISFSASDTAQILFATSTTGTSQHIFGSSDANKLLIEFDAGDLLQLTNCTVTIDGGAVADGADISSYLDGNLHTIIATATGSCSITHLAQNGSDASFFDGQLIDFETANEWSIGSGSIYYELAVGTAIGSDLFNPTLPDTLGYGESLSEDVGATAGDTYYLEYTISASTYTGPLFIPTSSSFPYKALDKSVGTHRYVIIANDAAGTIILSLGGGGSPTGSLTFTDTKLNKLPDTAIVYNNVQASDWETFKRTYGPDAWTALDGSPVLEII
jgi:hypothetical protein